MSIRFLLSHLCNACCTSKSYSLNTFSALIHKEIQSFYLPKRSHTASATSPASLSGIYQSTNCSPSASISRNSTMLTLHCVAAQTLAIYARCRLVQWLPATARSPAAAPRRSPVIQITSDSALYLYHIHVVRNFFNISKINHNDADAHEPHCISYYFHLVHSCQSAQYLPRHVHAACGRVRQRMRHAAPVADHIEPLVPGL